MRRLDTLVARPELVGLLETSDDPRYQKLAALLLDPIHRGKTLATIARKVDIGYPDLLRFITSARLAEGVLQMSAHVPQVLEDVAIDAKSRIVTCPACEGKKVIAVKRNSEADEDGGPDGEPTVKQCPTCEGTGKLRKLGDADARSLVFETFGLTGKGKGGVIVNVNQQSAGVPSMEDELDRATKLLDMPAQAADATHD